MTAVEWLQQQQKELLNQVKSGEFKIEDFEYYNALYIEQAKKMEKEQMIDFALFRDDYLEKAEKLEDFTIPNEKLIILFKHETFKSE